MVDPSDENDKLTERLVSSPTLLTAWRKLSSIEVAYAWHLLNHSWLLPPDFPREQIPRKPLLRIWDNAGGWTEQEPETLTVFDSFEGPLLCRHTVWHSKRPSRKDRLIQFLDSGGQFQIFEPHFTVRDAVIAPGTLEPHLLAISQLKVPAISRMIPGNGSVTTDAGSYGFEFFSQSDPPAVIRYEWSNTYPLEWQPLIAEVQLLRDLLHREFCD